MFKYLSLAIGTALISFLSTLKLYGEEFVLEKKIDAMAKQAIEAFQVPGIAIGIIVDGKIVHTKGYGFRDVSRNLPVTEHTVFATASCTKSFTSFAMAQLVEEGKISWDDPVVKHIPEFRLVDAERGKNITVRDLLAHRTGYARHDVLWHTILNFSRRDLVELLSKLNPETGFREKFIYNNFMYMLAGEIIERVSHKPWEEVIEEQILRPFGLSDASLTLEEMEKGEDVSKAYAELQGVVQEIPKRRLDEQGAASALNASVADLTKWVQIQLLASQGPFQEMHAIQMTIPSGPEALNPLQLGYGLGWFVGDFGGHRWMSHGGFIDGFATEMSFLPEKGMGLVVLTNCSPNGKYAFSYLRNAIFDHLLGLEGADRLKPVQEERLQAKESIKREVASIAPAVNNQNYLGRYFHPAYGALEIEAEGDHLFALLGKAKVPLIPKKENLFLGEFSSLLIYGIDPFIEFSFKENGEVWIPFEHFYSGKPMVFTKKIADSF